MYKGGRNEGDMHSAARAGGGGGTGVLTVVVCTVVTVVNVVAVPNTCRYAGGDRDAVLDADGSGRLQCGVDEVVVTLPT